MRRANRPASRAAQRGAAAIFAAISLVTLLSAVALSIDIGRLYYANRDLQRLADLAAIDGARVKSQCLGSAAQPEVIAEVAESLRRNRLPEGVTVSTRLGLRRSNDQGLQVFEPTPPGAASDSVQVTLSGPSPARILPLFGAADARTLTTRAAASAQWVASARIGPPLGADGNANFRPDLLIGGGGGSLGAGGGSSAGGGSAEVSVTDLLNASAQTNTPQPDSRTPRPVQGLLSQLAALLDATGDGAAATSVSSYAATIAAARPGATVVPSQILGLPLSGSYDGATVPVGALLNSIAGAVSQGDPLPLGSICNLIDLDQATQPVKDVLSPVVALPAFCDSTVTIRLPQPGKPGVFNSSTETDSNSSSDDSAAASSGGVAAANVGFVNPLDGKTATLPLIAVAEPGRARVDSLSCARLGQSFNQANLSANGPRVTFAVGQSDRFQQLATDPGSATGSTLDDLRPAVVLTASVQQVLAAAGLGGVLLANPLNAAALDQPVRLSVRAGPFAIGNGGRENLCMQGPPYGVAEQCDGAPATVGGVTSAEAEDQLGEQLSNVQVTVEAPGNLPPALSGVLATATAQLSQRLADGLRPTLRESARRLVPVLQSVNLVVGESAVFLDSAEALPPQVYEH